MRICMHQVRIILYIEILERERERETETETETEKQGYDSCAPHRAGRT